MSATASGAAAERKRAPAALSLRFRVDGMRCAACAARVEGLLREQPGVESATVNFAAGEARVLGQPDAAALRSELARAGYGLAARAAGASRDDASGGSAKLLLSAALSVPLFGIAMFGLAFPGSDWLQALLATPVVFLCGAEFHHGAWLRARQLSSNMDTLVSLGTLAAYGASAVALVQGGPLFFESAAVITTLVLLGRQLERRARGRATEAVTRLAALRADEACVLRDGKEHRVPSEALAVGDVLVIRPGEKVPSDAVVLEGHSVLDESMFTGEPLPRPCGPGDELRGASLNGSGHLVARTVRVGRDTFLSGVVRLVEDMQAAKAPVERLVDRVASHFVPLVLLIAAGTAIGWLAVEAPVIDAFTRAVAVLVVACPCALGLATPTAIAAGTGRGAELGILFKGGDVFERSRDIDLVLFDKTGTLTRGQMRLAELIGCETPQQEKRLLQAAATLEAASEHIIARAIVRGAEERGLEASRVRDFEATPGRGATGRVRGKRVRVGAPDWIEAQGLMLRGPLRGAVHHEESRGGTVVLCAVDDEVIGGLVLRDTPHEHAAEAVSDLRARGIEVEMVTGDNQRAARALADELGIQEVIAGALPSDKATAIRIHQERGRRVAFVGDGINDAPALQQADLGLAVGTGTDIAIESGGAVLVSGDPRLAGSALELARRTYNTIAQNLFWAFVYNTAAIPLAASGHLDPMLAAAAMSLSSVSVVTNSLRLRR